MLRFYGWIITAKATEEKRPATQTLKKRAKGVGWGALGLAGFIAQGVPH